MKHFWFRVKLIIGVLIAFILLSILFGSKKELPRENELIHKINKK